MLVIAVIHARGGSKRIPRKNIKYLCGKPLVVYMIEAALKSKLLTRVIVSTDDPEIAEISKASGADVPFIRPSEISEDVPSEFVTQHAVNFVENETGKFVDIAVTLQPTTPFCLPEDIDACVEKLVNTGADSVISMKEVSERPEWMFKVEKETGKTISVMGSLIQGEVGVVQTLPKLYIPNGGIYATKRDVLLKENLIIGKNNRAVIMPRERSVDIDEPIDFIFAELVLQEYPTLKDRSKVVKGKG